jgi:hypothetical protein
MLSQSSCIGGRRDSGARPGIAHLLSAFRGPYMWLTIKVSLMVMGAQGGVWAVNFWMPRLGGKAPPEEGDSKTAAQRSQRRGHEIQNSGMPTGREMLEVLQDTGVQPK